MRSGLPHSVSMELLKDYDIAIFQGKACETSCVINQMINHLFHVMGLNVDTCYVMSQNVM